MAFLARVLPRPLGDVVLFLDLPLTSQAPGQRSWLPPAPSSGLGLKFMASRKRWLYSAKTHLGYSLTSRAVYCSLSFAHLDYCGKLGRGKLALGVRNLIFRKSKVFVAPHATWMR
jgi:hypothetical protein